MRSEILTAHLLRIVRVKWMRGSRERLNQASEAGESNPKCNPGVMHEAAALCRGIHIGLGADGGPYMSMPPSNGRSMEMELMRRREVDGIRLWEQKKEK